MRMNSLKINANAQKYVFQKKFISDDFGNDISIVEELECHVLLSHKYAEQAELRSYVNRTS